MQKKAHAHYHSGSRPGAPGHETVHEAITGERKWRMLRRLAEGGKPRKYGRGGMSTDGKSSNIHSLIKL